LQRSIDQRNEAVKNMVKENFSRFINAKNSVELVFNDMKQRGLTSSDHGLSQADKSLQGNKDYQAELYLMQLRGFP